jgi:hypothetical protein
MSRGVECGVRVAWIGGKRGPWGLAVHAALDSRCNFQHIFKTQNIVRMNQ